MLKRFPSCAFFLCKTLFAWCIFFSLTSSSGFAQIIEKNQTLWRVMPGSDTVKLNYITSHKDIGTEAWQIRTSESEYLLSKNGDSLVPVREELMPSGETWKLIEKNYGQICACLESSQTSKADALRQARKKGYLPEDESTYEVKLHVVRHKFSCLWQIDVFKSGFKLTDEAVASIQVDMSNGHIAGKKFGE